MSLILGYYSKKGKAAAHDIRNVLDDFSLSQERVLRTEVRGKLIASAMQTDWDCIVENENRSAVILFSGNVYDFGDKVRRLIQKGHRFKNPTNGAEFILHSYEEYGDSFLRDLTGVFAFAIYDRRKDELILANDSFGLYPLFIYNKNGCCIFCTEYEPITKYGKFDKALNHDAIAEYFTLGLPLGDKTFFRDINNMPPGSVARIKPDSTTIRRYEDLAISVNRDKEIGVFAQEVAAGIRKAVQARVGGGENVRCALTGGADTRMILSCLTEDQRKKTVFFTENSPFLEPDADKDVMVAMMLAGKLGLNHEVVKQKRYTFGTAYFDETRLRSPEKVISGLCGSQFMGGSCYRYSPIRIADINDEKRALIQNRLKKLFDESILNQIADPYETLTEEIGKIRAENKQYVFSIFQFARGYFTNIFGGTRNTWLDSYRHWTKQESPFCDTDLLKMLLTVPKAYLGNHRLYEEMYRHHFPELTRIPTNSPLARRNPDSCMTYICDGTEPKKVRNPNYSDALNMYLRCGHTWDKQLYRSKSMMRLICYSEQNAAMRFLMKLITLLEKKHEPLHSLQKYMAAKGKASPGAEWLRMHVSSREEDSRLIDSFTDFEAWYRALVV